MSRYLVLQEDGQVVTMVDKQLNVEGGIRPIRYHILWGNNQHSLHSIPEGVGTWSGSLTAREPVGAEVLQQSCGVIRELCQQQLPILYHTGLRLRRERERERVEEMLN